MGIFRQSSDAYGNPNTTGQIGPYNGSPGARFGASAQNPYSSAYQTPGWTQSYRASQQQGQNYGPESGEPTTPESINMLFNPLEFRSMPYDQNPYNYQDQYTQGLIGRPADRVTGFAQQIGLPFLGMAMNTRLGAAKVARRNKLAGRMAGGATAGWKSTFTNSSRADIEAAAARARGTTGLFNAAGDSFGRGIGHGFFGLGRRFSRRGLFADSTKASALRNGISDTLGAIGGGVSGLAGSFLATEAEMKVADSAIFRPYIDTHRGSRALRAGFQNVYMGQSHGGNPIGGFGISHKSAFDTSGQVELSGNRNMGFNGKTFQAISDYATRSGMFNDVSDSSQIPQRVESLAKEVKLVMTAAQMPSVKDAVKLLSKIKQMGASDSGGLLSQASSVVRGLSNQAAVGGTTFQDASRVGSEGAGVLKQAGLTPYLGMLSTSSMYSGFRSAFRQGLINPSMMAMMGGSEGAAMSSAQGLAGVLSGNVFQMSLYNGAHGGRNSKTIAGALSGPASEKLAQNPTAFLGNLDLGKQYRTSEYIKQHGAMGAISLKAHQLSSANPNLLGKDGKINASAFAGALRSEGMSSEQIRGILSYIRLSQNRPLAHHDVQAMDSQARKRTEGIRNASGLIGGDNFAGRAMYGVERAWKTDVVGPGTRLVNRANRAIGGAEDAVNSALHGFTYGDKSPSYVVGSRKNFSELSDKVRSHAGDMDTWSKTKEGKNTLKALGNLTGHSYTNPEDAVSDIDKIKGVTPILSSHVSKKSLSNYIVGPDGQPIVNTGKNGIRGKDTQKAVGVINDVLSGKIKAPPEVLRTARKAVGAKTHAERVSAYSQLADTDFMRNQGVSNTLSSRAFLHQSDKFTVSYDSSGSGPEFLNSNYLKNTSQDIMSKTKVSKKYNKGMAGYKLVNDSINILRMHADKKVSDSDILNSQEAKDLASAYPDINGNNVMEILNKAKEVAQTGAKIGMQNQSLAFTKTSLSDAAGMTDKKSLTGVQMHLKYLHNQKGINLDTPEKFQSNATLKDAQDVILSRMSSVSSSQKRMQQTNQADDFTFSKDANKYLAGPSQNLDDASKELSSAAKELHGFVNDSKKNQDDNKTTSTGTPYSELSSYVPWLSVNRPKQRSGK